MKLFRDEEEAVSPVIGVILMVAIVVILAAVIAAFVFGMAGSTSSTKAIAVTTQQQGSDIITLTYQGGKNDADVSEIHYSVTPEGGTAIRDGDAGAIAFANRDGTAPDLSVGDVVTVTAAAPVVFTAKDHVVVTATFTDGTKQVILDTYI